VPLRVPEGREIATIIRPSVRSRLFKIDHLIFCSVPSHLEFFHAFDNLAREFDYEILMPNGTKPLAWASSQLASHSRQSRWRRSVKRRRRHKGGTQRGTARSLTATPSALLMPSSGFQKPFLSVQY
jgi:hypothetical protein